MKIYKFAVVFFFKKSNIFSFIHQKRFLKIKNSIRPPKYTKYGKYVKKQNCLSKKDLQIFI